MTDNPVDNGNDTVEVSQARQGRFTTQGTQILLDGTPFQFVGVNMRELAYYGYRGWKDGFLNEHDIARHLDKAAEMRAQVVRFYAPYHLDANRQPGTDVGEARRRIQIVLDALQKRNMFAIVCLDDNKESGFNVSIEERFRQPNGKYNMEYYRNEYKRTYIPFIEQIVPRFANHKAVMAWEVCNEVQINPNGAEDLVARNFNIFLDFFSDCTKTLRRLAPNHLTATGVEDTSVLFGGAAHAL